MGYCKLLVCASVTIMLGACAVTGSLEKEQIAEISAGQKGGVLIVVSGANKSCPGLGRIAFYDEGAKQRFVASYVFGLFGTKDNTNVIAADPGTYYPVSINCIAESQKGNYKVRKTGSFGVIPGEPLIIKAGEVTNPGTLHFPKSGKLLRYYFKDDAKALTEEFVSKYPDLNIVEK